ncbi:TlyA family RNA methyltransferase [Acaricomes phytoseiuli]|uniref:TlyA family RNA methyltransferase n=1 Tax=Acaricomes phytoseiuli TaxID=291968 RepID=UPI000375FAE4|nr:TlyA family RNA methyltransferase [Acaricomes phytoseiuli]MCW1249438.1 TlyA family RNA methyltransferase [Acaricomes phytoseiuli]
MPRLDQELLSRGLARSRTQAAKLIAEGVVRIDGAVAEKPAQHVDAGADLSVQPSDSSRYVSRAALKLQGALDRFGIDPSGLRCLDAGASTGGFTQVLLEAGAAEVLAVDVGHGQLVESLRADSRVRVHEGLNIRDLDSADLDGQAALTVADLSFISLTLVLAPLARATERGGELLLMVKPQFEVGRERLAKTGVVTSESERRRAVTVVLESALDAGLLLLGIAMSALPGQDGNREYFLWLSKPSSSAENDSAGGEVLSAWQPKAIMLEGESPAAVVSRLWPEHPLSG